MNRILALLLFSMIVQGTMAQDRNDAFVDLLKESTVVINEQALTPMGGITLGKLEEIAEGIYLASQKMEFVQRARTASLILPGVGQFINGDVVGGSLFLLMELAIVGGTIVGAYFLLPSDLQFHNLDYVNKPSVDIRNVWESHSLMDLLLPMGVAAGGLLVEIVLRGVASFHAGEVAKKNIAEGKISFEPGSGSALTWIFLTTFPNVGRY